MSSSNTNTNKRSSLLLSNLSAINTTGLMPLADAATPIFSSSTIASTASSSSSPVQPLTPLCHPVPRRCSAAHSTFMKSDAEVRAPTPPKRPLTPLSPIVARNNNNRPASFFDFDSSESEQDADSPLSPYILSPTFQDMVYPVEGLRTRWADLNRPPTPAPNVPPPVPQQRASIRQWESKVPRYMPHTPQSATSSRSSNTVRSPVEEEIGALSQQITELHAHIAASEQMFKSGMMYVYIHQNAQAAALVHSPNLIAAPWSAELGDADVEDLCLSPQEVACMEGVKQSLRDRLEKEVNEVERRAMRDLEMVRGVRHGLILEAEREAARERRRNLEVELQLEMEREKQRQLQITCNINNDAMEIDNSNNNATSDEGFYETFDAPLMLDVKSMSASPAVATNPDEIVFSFSTDEIDAAIADSLLEQDLPSLTTDNDSSSDSDSSRSTSPELEAPITIKSPTPLKRNAPAPLRLSTGSSTLDISSPLLSLFRSPLSPAFSPCSPLLSSKSATFAATAAPLGSARMSVDLAAGLGFDLSTISNISNAALESGVIEVIDGKVALCA